MDSVRPLRGGPWTPDERRALLDYCQSDVDALERLLARMDGGIDTPRALLRGQYMAAAARPASRAFCPDLLPQHAPRPRHDTP